MTKSNKRFTSILLASTALIAGLGLAIAPASAGSIKNNSPVELTIGGQLNRAFLYVNDGEEGMYRHVDNENDSTRIFLNAEGTINENWSVGTQFIMLMRSNPSNEMSASVESAGTSAFEEEAAELFITHKRLGTLWMGQGDTHDTVGLQAVQEIEGTGSSLYVAYRYHTLDRTGTDFDAIHAVMTGAFVAF